MEPRDREMMKAAILRKESNIKQSQDRKSIQIAISSTFNSASDIMRVLVEKGTVPPPPDAAYWTKHNVVFKDMLKHFYDAQDEGYNFYAEGIEDEAAHETYKKDKVAENKELHAMDEGQRIL